MNNGMERNLRLGPRGGARKGNGKESEECIVGEAL
jgi:hypothetical protein